MAPGPALDPPRAIRRRWDRSRGAVAPLGVAGWTAIEDVRAVENFIKEIRSLMFLAVYKNVYTERNKQTSQIMLYTSHSAAAVSFTLNMA